MAGQTLAAVAGAMGGAMMLGSALSSTSDALLALQRDDKMLHERAIVGATMRLPAVWDAARAEMCRQRDVKKAPPAAGVPAQAPAGTAADEASATKVAAAESRAQVDCEGGSQDFGFDEKKVALSRWVGMSGRGQRRPRRWWRSLHSRRAHVRDEWLVAAEAAVLVASTLSLTRWERVDERVATLLARARARSGAGSASAGAGGAGAPSAMPTGDRLRGAALKVMRFFEQGAVALDARVRSPWARGQIMTAVLSRTEAGAYDLAVAALMLASADPQHGAGVEAMLDVYARECRDRSTLELVRATQWLIRNRKATEGAENVCTLSKAFGRTSNCERFVELQRTRSALLKKAKKLRREAYSPPKETDTATAQAAGGAAAKSVAPAAPAAAAATAAAATAVAGTSGSAATGAPAAGPAAPAVEVPAPRAGETPASGTADAAAPRQESPVSSGSPSAADVQRACT